MAAPTPDFAPEQKQGSDAERNPEAGLRESTGAVPEVRLVQVARTTTAAVT